MALIMIDKVFDLGQVLIALLFIFLDHSGIESNG